MSCLPDAELLARFHAGDECALEVLFERYEPPLYHFLLGVLRDHHQAEDALQETFIKAVENGHGVQPDKFKSWLFTVGFREAMLLKRKQKRDPRMTLEPSFERADDDFLGPEDLAVQGEQAHRLRQLLELLPTHQRDTIRARIYEGKRFREIAATQGCPLNTTLARMHEGLKRLRSLWEQHDG